MKIVVLISLFFALFSCLSQENKGDSPRVDGKSEVDSESKIVKSDIIVLLNCADSSLLDFYHFVTPDSCSKIFEESTGEIDDNTRDTMFSKCIYDCLSNPQNNYKCDTIYLPSLDVMVWIRGITTWEDQFFREKNETLRNDGTLYGSIEYYNIEELAGVCVTGDFRVKSIELWKDGKRNGTCEYYSESGELKRLVEYKLGTIISDENY